jgi:RecA/RadA recombinase
LATGIPDIDRLLGGGFPRGRLSELAGPVSAGRTSLALALLARVTRAGEVTAVVDAADAFDPVSAEATGVLLDRVLWVRAPGLREALRSAQHLLEARGFALVLLNLAVPGARVPPAVCPRLARAAAATGTALLMLSLGRLAGTAAELALELKATQARFRGTPPLLEELEIEAALVRHRSAPTGRAASVHLRADSAA